MGRMKKLSIIQSFALAAALLVAILAAPVRAEEPVSPPAQEEGLSLMEQGMLLFFEGLQKEMEPAIGEFRKWMEEAEPALRDFAAEMGPALSDLMDQVEDWSAYHPPEMLPNGDIIIRRKADDELNSEETEI